MAEQFRLVNYDSYSVPRFIVINLPIQNADCLQLVTIVFQFFLGPGYTEKQWDKAHKTDVYNNLKSWPNP